VLGAWTTSERTGTGTRAVTASELDELTAAHALNSTGQLPYLLAARRADGKGRIVLTLWVSGGRKGGPDDLPDADRMGTAASINANLSRALIEQSKCLTTVVRELVGRENLTGRLDELLRSGAHAPGQGKTEFDFKIRQLEVESESSSRTTAAIVTGLKEVTSFARGLAVKALPAAAPGALEQLFADMAPERSAELLTMLGPTLAGRLLSARGPKLAEALFAIGCELERTGKGPLFLAFFTPAEGMTLSAAFGPMIQAAQAEREKANGAARPAAPAPGGAAP